MKREKTGIRDIIDKAHSMQGQWAGHLAGMNDTRWAKKTTEWTPRDGKRREGRSNKKMEIINRGKVWHILNTNCTG